MLFARLHKVTIAVPILFANNYISELIIMLHDIVFPDIIIICITGTSMIVFCS